MDSSDEDDMFAPPTKMARTAENGLAIPTKPISDAEETNSSQTLATVPVNKTLADNWDNEEGYYRHNVGELMNGRYSLTRHLGSGVFSSVVKGMDRETNREVAIKVIRSNDTMLKAGRKELKVLRKLNDADPKNRRHVIQLLDSFEHRNHICLVFEAQAMNLREVIRQFGRDVGLNIKAVQLYAFQLFFALQHLEACNVIHADIKPDNILVNEAKNSVKLCDLGSAIFVGETEITPYLVSRFYRAPEIILGLTYGPAIDTWSLACTLYELYTGKILFPGQTNNQMLRLMQEIKGKMPHQMVRQGRFSGQHFDDNFYFLSQEEDKATHTVTKRKVAYTQQPQRDLRTQLLVGRDLREPELSLMRHFVNFLDRCLSLNPKNRLTPVQALAHPFLASLLEQQPQQAK